MNDWQANWLIIIMEKKTKELMHTILIVLIVVALGLFSLNQFILFSNFSQAIRNPCGVCESLNPHLEKCFKDTSIVVKGSDTLINITTLGGGN